MNVHGLKRYARWHPIIQIICGSDLGTAGLSDPGTCYVTKWNEADGNK